MPDMGADDIELTDDEWREVLAILFGGSKRTPEQTKEAKDRLSSALQMRPAIAPPQPQPIQEPGEIKSKKLG